MWYAYGLWLCTSSWNGACCVQGWHKYVCYGVLVCKLQLPRGVGIVANLHNVAIQVNRLLCGNLKIFPSLGHFPVKPSPSPFI